MSKFNSFRRYLILSVLGAVLGSVAAWSQAACDHGSGGACQCGGCSFIRCSVCDIGGCLPGITPSDVCHTFNCGKPSVDNFPCANLGEFDYEQCVGWDYKCQVIACPCGPSHCV